MTPTLKDLIAQRAALDSQIAETEAVERAGAVQKVRALMADYDLSIRDLSTRAAKTARGPKAGSLVAAKYRDKETGATWSGRGLKPKWLAGKLAAGAKIEDLAV